MRLPAPPQFAPKLRQHFLRVQQEIEQADRQNLKRDTEVSGRVIHNRIALTDADATPSVANGYYFVTGNTGATTVTDFDDGVVGQEILVEIGDANTTIDFTGTNLKGNAGVDWSPTAGDFMRCTYNGTNWLCDVVEV